MLQAWCFGNVHKTVTSSENCKVLYTVRSLQGCWAYESRLCPSTVSLIGWSPIVPHSKERASAFVWASHSLQKVGSCMMECFHFITNRETGVASPAKAGCPRHQHSEVAWCRACEKAPMLQSQSQPLLRVQRAWLSLLPARSRGCPPLLYATARGSW